MAADHPLPDSSRRRGGELSRRALLVTIGTGLGLAGCLSVLVAQAPRPSSPVGGPAGVSWKRIFSEEFGHSAAAVLASGRWRFGWYGDGMLTAAVNRKETSGYDRSLFRVEQGQGVFGVRANHGAQDTGSGPPLNLGAIITTDPSQGASPGFTMGYGYVEARLQQPAGNSREAVWPAFWLNGTDWPSTMEIDVVEGDGTDVGSAWNVHLGPVGKDVTNLNHTHHSATVEGATAGMHTYGADIRPDGVTFYYDGAAVGAHDGPVPDAQRYLVIGATTSGRLTTGKSMRVDHVRAWVRAD